MNEPTCDSIAEMLVDYSDGDLSASDRRRVERHLSGCPACRSEVERLGRSLELARSVWDQAAAEASRCTIALRAPRPRRRETRVRLAAVAAACAALVLAGLGVWLLAGGHGEVAWREGPASPQRPEVASTGPKAAGPSGELGIETILARETRAARLAAAARLLATEPSLKAYRVEAERYLTETYPEASAIHSSGRQGMVPSSKEPKS